jgi:hypothetical protein
MQTEAPEVVDLSGETRATFDLYGIGVEPTDDYGRRRIGRLPPTRCRPSRSG